MRRDTESDPLGWAGSTVLAIFWGLLALALAVTALFTEPAVELLSRYVHGASEGQVSVEAAEQIRRYAVGLPSDVPADPEGLVGLDPAARSHLLDVRTVVRTSGIVAVALIGLLVVAGARAAASRRFALLLARSMRAAGVGVVAVVAAVGGAVLLSFDAVFVLMHQVLFADGTWTFSSESLLIRTFPEPFWIAAAALLLAAVVGLAAALLLASALVQAHATREPEIPQMPRGVPAGD